jgi:NitT/TauT family transport system substrate-binding protein
VRLVLIVALGASLLPGGVAHAIEDYGLPGQPIHLVVGYLGTTPTVDVATTPASDGTRIRIVATSSLGHNLCNILLVRRDAPAFAKPEDAFKWIGQRTFAVPYQTCAYAFALQLLDRSAKPRVIILSGAFIVAREDLLNQRPDVVNAWLRAEYDAQQFIATPGNRQAVVRGIGEQTSGLSAAAIDNALRPMLQPFDVTPQAIEVLNQTADTLSVARIEPDAVSPEIAREILREHAQ